MRALKLILTVLLAAVAATAGLFVAAVAALIGVAVYVTTRLLGRPSRFHMASRSRGQPAAAPRRNAHDAIEVTATEVAAEPAPSLTSGQEAGQRFRE